jgi:hypothetical protein
MLPTSILAALLCPGATACSGSPAIAGTFTSDNEDF